MDMMPWILLVYFIGTDPFTMKLEYKQEFENHEACMKEIPKYQHKEKMVICSLKRTY